MVVTLLATFAAMVVGSQVATKAFLALHGRMPVDSGVDFPAWFAILFGVEGDILIVLSVGVAAVVRAIRRRRPRSTESVGRTQTRSSCGWPGLSCESWLSTPAQY